MKQEIDIIEKMKENKKFPKELKEKMNQTVFKNVVLGSIVILYFIFVNLGYYNIIKDVFIVDIKVFSMCLIVISIVLFEKSYAKKNGELAIYGIEIFIVALITLFMQYIYFYQNNTFIKLYMLVPVLFAIYYVIKSTIIVAKIQDSYRKNISDVKEIIKKEKKVVVEEPIEDKDAIQEKITTKKIKEDKKEIQQKLEKNLSKKKTTTKTTTTKKATTTKKNTKNGQKNTTRKTTNKTGDIQK